MYASVMGLTYQSFRLQASMSENLVKMGTEAALAAQHQETADADFALSSEAHEKAGVDKAQGETLQGEADALYAKADQDEAEAVAEETVADEEAAKAAGEEEQAVGHFAEAGTLQAAVDADRAEAVVESAAASRAEFTAHGDELGTGLCEMIPVLDIVCDIVGGTAAVGLEATAAKDVVESAALIAAAVEAETKEKAELALAAELQSAAAEDGEIAAEGHTTAAELEAETEAELAKAQEEETAAQEKLDESVLEEETAEEEQGEAVEEEAQSDASFAKSAQYGVAALLNAFMATAFSFLAVGFFAVRFTSVIVSSAATNIPAISTNGANGSPFKRLGQVSLHCIIFGIILGCYGSTFFLYFDSLQVRARGGIILLFALNVAVVQAFLVQALPAIWLTQGNMVCRMKASSATFVRCVACLFLLIVLEFLILRVMLGRSLLTTAMLNGLRQWYMWFVLALSLTTYYWFCTRKVVTVAEAETKTLEVMTGVDDGSSLDPSGASSYGAMMDKSMEASSLESAPLVASIGTEQETAPTSCLASARRYFEQYQLPFDLLIAACAFAILRVSLPNIRHLWPVSKTIIMANAHLHWWMIAASAATVVLGVAAVSYRCCKRQRES